MRARQSPYANDVDDANAMENAEKRTRYDVEADVLQVAGQPGGAHKTRIVYRANLNFSIVAGYLDRLERAGLLARRGDRYATTDEGRAFLERYYELRALRRVTEDPELGLLRRLHEPV